MGTQLICLSAHKHTHMHLGAHRLVHTQYTHLCTHSHSDTDANTHMYTQKLKKFHKVCCCFSLPKNEEIAEYPWK